MTKKIIAPSFADLCKRASPVGFCYIERKTELVVLTVSMHLKLYKVLFCACVFVLKYIYLTFIAHFQYKRVIFY